MSRVLLVGKGPPERGGIAVFLSCLMSSRLADAYELELLNLTRPSEPQGGRFNLANLRRTASDLLGVWRAAKDRDLVHIHSAMAPLVTMARASLFAVVARLRGARVVIHAHGGLLVGWSSSSRRRRLTRLLLAPAHEVIAVAASVSEVLADSVAERRLSLVDNGVDLERYLAPPARDPHPRPPRILYAGLLTPRKGVLDLIEASRLLRDRGVDHELWLAGGTPDEGPAAEQQVREAADAEHVVLLGPREPAEMPALYRDADVFCLPSWWEAMPLTVLEAMATGLPVVATRVGDVPRLVEDGVTGHLVTPRAPAELADELERLLVDGAARRRMGAAGRTRVAQTFSLERTLERIDALYRGDVRTGTS